MDRNETPGPHPTPPISPGGAKAAIQARLAARHYPPSFFDRSAVAVLVEHASGSPKRLRAALDRVFALIEHEGAAGVDAPFVRRALGEVELAAAPPPPIAAPSHNHPLWLAGIGAALGALLIVWFAIGDRSTSPAVAPPPPGPAPVQPAAAPDAHLAASPDRAAGSAPDPAVQQAAAPSPVHAPEPAPAPRVAEAAPAVSTPPPAPLGAAPPPSVTGPAIIPSQRAPATPPASTPAPAPRVAEAAPAVSTPPPAALEAAPPSSVPGSAAARPDVASPAPAIPASPPNAAATATAAPSTSPAPPPLPPAQPVAPLPVPARPAPPEPPKALILYDATSPAVQQHLASLSARLRDAGIGQIERRPVAFGTALGHPISYFHGADLPLAQRAAGVLASEGWPNLPVQELAPRLIKPRGAARQRTGLIELQLP